MNLDESLKVQRAASSAMSLDSAALAGVGFVFGVSSSEDSSSSSSST